MPGPRDASTTTMLRASTDGNLTIDENVTATLTKGSPHVANLGVYVLVPQASTGDTLKVTAKITTSGDKIEVTHTDDIDDNTTFPFLLILPLPPTKSDATALTVNLNVTDGGGGVNFGAVQVWLERSEHAKVDA